MEAAGCGVWSRRRRPPLPAHSPAAPAAVTAPASPCCCSAKVGVGGWGGWGVGRGAGSNHTRAVSVSSSRCTRHRLSQQALLPESSASRLSCQKAQLAAGSDASCHASRTSVPMYTVASRRCASSAASWGRQPRAVLPHPVGRSSHGGMGAGREPGRVGALRRHPAGCEAGGGHSTRVSPPAGVCQDCFIPCLHRSHHHLTHAGPQWLPQSYCRRRR